MRGLSNLRFRLGRQSRMQHGTFNIPCCTPEILTHTGVLRAKSGRAARLEEGDVRLEHARGAARAARAAVAGHLQDLLGGAVALQHGTRVVALHPAAASPLQHWHAQHCHAQQRSLMSASSSSVSAAGVKHAFALELAARSCVRPRIMHSCKPARGMPSRMARSDLPEARALQHNDGTEAPGEAPARCSCADWRRAMVHIVLRNLRQPRQAQRCLIRLVVAARHQPDRGRLRCAALVALQAEQRVMLRG